MIQIAKTKETIQLEQEIYKATQKTGVFCCFEVTIGFRKNYRRTRKIQERVDYLTYDTKGIWRCYEIKSSKSDFYSKAEITFIGHYNYYVLTEELYAEVIQDIPDYVGVFVGGSCVKNPKKQELGVDEQILKDSMIRSLTRYCQKEMDSGDTSLIERKDRYITRLKREKETNYKRYVDLMNKVVAKYGMDWED